MAHDIFISYSSKDKHTANAVCRKLEESGLRCWIAPRNIQAGKSYAEQIMEGLKSAKIVVLIFSKNSQESVFVNNEIDTAFSNNKPIISYKIDETLPANKMGFFLKNKHWLDAYPNPEEHYQTLITDASRLCDETPIEEMEESYEDIDEEFDDSYLSIQDDSDSSASGFNKYKIPIIVGIAVILIAIIGVVALGGLDNNDSGSSNGISIDYIGVYEDNDSKYSWDYSYIVFGSIASDLSNSSKDIIHTDFYDESGNVVLSNDTKIKDFDGSTLGIGFTDKENIVKVSVQLQDSERNNITHVESDNVVK